MKNKTIDLVNHLFEELERLNDEDLSDDDLEREVKRCDSMVKVADKIIGIKNVEANVLKIAVDNGYEVNPSMLLDYDKKN